MKLQQTMPLSSIYNREEEFSAALADNLDALSVGSFSDYLYECNDSPKQIRVQFPALNKGKNNQNDWDEIREVLVTMGTDIYNKIRESDL